MTFIVFDQGYRTETPWYDLFPPKQVNPTEASSALHAPSLTREKDPQGEQPAHQSNNKTPYQQPISTRRRIGCASDIMSHPVVRVNQEQSVQAVSDAFKLHAVHHMPVMDAAGKLIGLVSDRDLLRHQASHQVSQQQTQRNMPTIKDIMTQRVLTAQPNTGIAQLAEVMVKHRIGALPIMDVQGQLQGIITRMDILSAIMTEAPIELWA